MQSCWLPPSQRPTVNEIFILLSSLLAADQGPSQRSVVEDEDDGEYALAHGRRPTGESEESFERRWNSIRSNAFHESSSEYQKLSYVREEGYFPGNDNSFPLLDPVDSIAPSAHELDDILTVTETSKGLNFEYFWEKAHARRGYKPLTTPQPIPATTSSHRQSLDTPTVVPVISARSPSLASEYYIRLEEHTPQDKSTSLKAKSFLSQKDSGDGGELELVEIPNGTLRKPKIVLEYQENIGAHNLQTVKSSEVQVLVPNTGLVEFSSSSNRVTDFAIIDIGDVKKDPGLRRSGSVTCQGPVLPPKPRSMSMSSGSHLLSRPLPVPPPIYPRSYGLPPYPVPSYPISKSEISDLFFMSCSNSKLNFDHLGLSRIHQMLPPSPSHSPSIPPSSGGHCMLSQPQNCPPPLPPHYRPQRGSYFGEIFSRHNNPAVHLERDQLSCEFEKQSEDRSTTCSQSLHNSTHFYKDRKSPTFSDTERKSSSSTSYSEDDYNSPFVSPSRLSSSTIIEHTSLADDPDPATAELFVRGMKRTQSRLDTILPAIWKQDAELHREQVVAAQKSPVHLFLTEVSNEPLESNEEESSWNRDDKKDTKIKDTQHSQSVLTELDSAPQARKSDQTLEHDCSEKQDLFLTEIDAVVSDCEDVYDGEGGIPVSRFGTTPFANARPQDLDICNEAVEGRSRVPEIESTKEISREEFLKEIQSAETFLTEIITRQREQEECLSSAITPEYETICIDPESAQTISFESEKSFGKRQNDDFKEAIYAQVTKRAKRGEIKVAMRPEMPVLEISSQLKDYKTETGVLGDAQSFSVESDSDSGPSDLSSKAGLVLDQTSPDPEEDNKVKIDLEDFGPGLVFENLSEDFPTSTSPREDTKTEAINRNLLTDRQIKEVTEMFLEGISVHERKKEQSRALKDSGMLPKVEGYNAEPIHSSEEPHRHDHPVIVDVSGVNTSLYVQEMRNNIDSPLDPMVKDGETVSETEAIVHTVCTVDNAEQLFSLEKSICVGLPDWPSSLASTPEMHPSPPIQKGQDSHQVSHADLSSSSTTVHAEDPMKEGIKTSESTLSLAEEGIDMLPLSLLREPNSEQSLSTFTPSDSAMSPLTSTSMDCLTPGEVWGSGGGSGWRVLGTETPHRDSAYFSDSDWETAEGSSRRTDGLGSSRPGSGRSAERILMGIEEKTEAEDDSQENKWHVQEFEKVVTLTELDTEETVEVISGKNPKFDENCTLSLESSKGDSTVMNRLFSSVKDEPMEVVSYGDTLLNYQVCSLSFDPDKEVYKPDHGSISIADVESLGKSDEACLNEEHFATQVLKPNEYQCSSKVGEFSEVSAVLKNEDLGFTISTGSETKAKAMIDIEKHAVDRQDTNSPDLTWRSSSHTFEIDEQPNLESEGQLAESELCFERKYQDNDGRKQETPTRAIKIKHLDEEAAQKPELKAELWNSLEKNEMTEQCLSEKVVCQFQQCNNDLETNDYGHYVTFESNQMASIEDDLFILSEKGKIASPENDQILPDENDWAKVENDQWAPAENQVLKTELDFLPCSIQVVGCQKDEGLTTNHGSSEEDEANDELAPSEHYPSIEDTSTITSNNDKQHDEQSLSLSEWAREAHEGQDKPEMDVYHVDNIENPVDLAESELQPNILETPRSKCYGKTHEEQELVFQRWITEAPESHLMPLLEVDVQRWENTENPEIDSGELEDDVNSMTVEVDNLDSPEQELLSQMNGLGTIDSDDFNVYIQNEAEDEFMGFSISENFTENDTEERDGKWEFDISQSLVTSQTETLDSVFTNDIPERARLSSECQDAEKNHCQTSNHNKREASFEKDRSESPSCPHLKANAKVECCTVHSNDIHCFSSALVSNEISDCVVSQHTKEGNYQAPDNFPNTVHHIEIKSSPVQEDTVNLTWPNTTDHTEEHSTNTHNKGITANLGQKTSVSVESPIHLSDRVNEDDRKSNSCSTISQSSLNYIPELLISEWKNLEEEPLEDFEKLEKLCCISGDEDILEDLLMENLELLESLKKNHQAVSNTKEDQDHTDDTDVKPEEEFCEISDVPLEKLQTWEENEEEEGDSLSKLSPCHSSDSSKSQRSLSQMQTQNGLMMQVRWNITTFCY